MEPRKPSTGQREACRHPYLQESNIAIQTRTATTKWIQNHGQTPMTVAIAMRINTLGIKKAIGMLSHKVNRWGKAPAVKNAAISDNLGRNKLSTRNQGGISVNIFILWDYTKGLPDVKPLLEGVMQIVLIAISSAPSKESRSLIASLNPSRSLVVMSFSRRYAPTNTRNAHSLSDQSELGLIASATNCASLIVIRVLYQTIAKCQAPLLEHLK